MQIVCNQEYYVAKIYGCNDFCCKMDSFGIEVGKKIVALSSDAGGKLTFSVEGSKKKCSFPKSYLSNLSLVAASDPQCQERIIEELDKPRIFLFQTKESYPTGLFGGDGSFRYENYDIAVTHLPSVDYIFGIDYPSKRLRNLLLSEKCDVIVAVVDFNKLETELEPVVQMMDLGFKIVLVVRGYCEENEDGLRFDLSKMSKYMGIPIALYDETDETGVSRGNVVQTILSAYTGDNTDMRYVHVNYGRQVEQHIRQIQQKLEKEKGYDFNASSRYMAISLMEDDNIVRSFNAPCKTCDTVKCFVGGHSRTLGKKFDSHAYYVLKQARCAYIDAVVSKATGVRKEQWNTEKVDSVLLHKVWGFPLFLLMMAAVFCATFELGKFPMQWISSGVNSLSETIKESMEGGLFGSLLSDGFVGGVGAVLALIPNLLIYFLLIGILENSGYMSRASYCVDGVMRKFGLQGRTLIPLILGFGCSIPAIMSVRHIESRSDRILASLAIPFLPCAARIPICILLVTAFFPKYPALVMFVVYLVGILLALAFAKIYSKTICKQAERPYIIELTSYQRPTVLLSLSYMWDRTWEYLKRISGIVVLGALVVWALSYFPRNAEDNTSGSVATEEQASYLEKFGSFVEPVFHPLGFDWKMTVGAISGMAGKELAFSTMSMLNPVAEMSADEEGEDAGGGAAALAFVFFILVCFPCLGATLTIRKVSGFKWAALSAGVSFVLAWIVAFGVYQVGMMI